MLIIKTHDVENMTSDIDSVSSWKDFYKTFHFLRWAQYYFKKDLWKRHVELHYHVQKYLHYGTQKAGYLVQAGSQSILDFVRHGISQTQTRRNDLESLLKSYHTGENQNRRVFTNEFLDWYFGQEWLSQFSMTAIPDGRVVHPGEPLFILKGSLPLVKALAKLISSIANLQIAAATRAARIRDAVQGQPIYVFVPSSWTINHNALYGAYAGGCSFLGGEDEPTAFEKAYPLAEVSQLLLSLDETVRNESQAYESFYPTEHQFCLKRNQDLNSVLPAVVKALKKLIQKKNKKLSVHLAGGDLVSASILLVKELLHAGLTDVRILVSHKFDEIRFSEFMGRIHEESSEKGIQPHHVIEKLMFLDSVEDSFLKEVTSVNGKWKVLLKKSDSCSQIWRLYGPRKKARWDICTANNNDLEPFRNLKVAAVNQPEKTYSIDRKISVSSMEPLLVPLIKEGKIVRSKISADDSVRMQDIHALNYESRQFINPGNYPVVRLTAGVKSRTKRK